MATCVFVTPSGKLNALLVKIAFQYFNDMFISNSLIHNYNTRQCDDFHVPYHRLVLASNSIRVYGVNVWNSIPKNLRNATSMKLFRTKFKLHLINN